MKNTYSTKLKDDTKFKFKNVILSQKREKFNQVIDSLPDFDFYEEEYEFALILASIMKNQEDGVNQAVNRAKDESKNYNLSHVNSIILNYTKNGPAYIKSFYKNNLPAELAETVKRVEAENKKYDKENLNI